MDKDKFLAQSKLFGYRENSLDIFAKAIDLIEDELKDKKRISGDTFFEHNLRIGLILVENKSVQEVVLAGLFHGHLSDPTLNVVREQFGKEVYSLIKEVEEIEEIKHRNRKLDAEALRKIFLTTLTDVRVILVKLANKLDNLRTVRSLPKNTQERVAHEVLEIYAPLAYRLGIDKIKTELEDLAFRILSPRKYDNITNFLKESNEQRQKNIVEAIRVIKRVVNERIDVVSIDGRSKQVYSIYKKLKKKKTSLNKLFDLLGIRIIVSDEKDCYSLLGLLHEVFEPIEDRLKDYIANPKPNLYRSIHTGVKLPNGTVAEIQIRTPEMNEFAEEGIAAHWRYKGMSSEQSFEKKIAWLRGILDLQKDEGNKEFLEAAKVDVFGDSIYCYTPKGDTKELPKNATILDFAFSVHEEVGNHSVGGRVNGKFVPLKHIITHGDVVEIVTNKNQRPRRSWIKLVKSSKARQKIRKSLKKYEKLPALYFRTFKPTITEEQGILVESEEFPNAFCVLAKCCNPLPGEDIVGILTKRKIVSTHKDDCRLAKKEEERWVPVNWKEAFNQKIKFYINAHERSGLLADLLHTIANAGFEVKEAKAKLVDMEHAQCNFSVIPRDLGHLKELVNRVNKVKGVTKVFFE
ncbi:bifunctional (p)ppGpp synthetase/guanosine-3',5'-bis(diphosphate) 3'-pyrophosphohydrolase [Candidatus Woesearchaeota archaeon]|jgi:GTP diphosphokinase / guanosine-3',5'-bis(diphosphate) 3'-diphosphatase|nr:bifunctional (p)ppGpp synthetase/guanosine-3',5'-bis(diphosphate) 3'-pyrophosphohydrolase [Candidatus Woesearchaeota archaeon]